MPTTKDPQIHTFRYEVKDGEILYTLVQAVLLAHKMGEAGCSLVDFSVRGNLLNLEFDVSERTKPFDVVLGGPDRDRMDGLVWYIYRNMRCKWTDNCTTPSKPE